VKDNLPSFPNIEGADECSTGPRLRPVIVPRRGTTPAEAEPTPPRPVIRSAEGLRRVFRVDTPRPERPEAPKAGSPAPGSSQARKPPPGQPTPQPPLAASATPTTLGGVRTAALEPQGVQLQPRATARRTAQWLASKMLTIIEVITVAALVVVVVLAMSNLAALNEEAAAEQRRLLTPSPTSLGEGLRQRAVLPGSSQPPPGEEEIPPQFRPYLLPSTPLPLPTPGPRQATRLVIKKIGVDAPVLEGDDWQTLKKGVGHTPGTANPGEPGNCVLSGHDDVYGEVFRYLSELKPGDEVLVYTSDGHSFKYVVKTSFLVLPDAVEVLDPTPEPILTLITCYPYLIDSHRLIVVCTLEGEAPPG